MTNGSRLRLRKRELFRAIGYEPHGVQIDLHRSSARIRVLACGTRFGKSTCAAAEVVAALLEPRPESIGWVVGPNLEVTERVMERVRLILHRHFPRRIEKEQEREKRLWVRNLGGGISEVRGKSADAPASLLGAELDWVVVDECATIRRAVWEEHVSARLLDRGGWAVLLSTPGGMEWFYELFLRGQLGADPECQSWRAPTWDNPHIDRALIEAERGRLTPEVFEQQFGARFTLEAPIQCTCCGFPSAEPCEWFMVAEPWQLLFCRVCQNPVDQAGGTVVHRREDGTLAPYVLVYGVPDPDAAGLGDLGIASEESAIVGGAESAIP